MNKRNYAKKAIVLFLILLMGISTNIVTLFAEETQDTFQVLYYPDEDSAASSIVTTCIYGGENQLTPFAELGFQKEGKSFYAWKVKNDFNKWCLDNPQGEIEWVEIQNGTLPQGYSYHYFYDNGTISRTVKSGYIHLYPVWVGITVDVTAPEFGANGADQLSDYSAIQKALNLAKYTDELVTVNIPAGTYYLDMRLTVYSHTYIKAAEGTRIVRRDQIYGMISSEKDETVGGYGQFSDITIDGGIWDANGSAGTSISIPMVFYHGSNLTIKNCTIKNGSGKHLVIIAAVDSATVSNVTFDTVYPYKGTDKESISQYYNVDEEGNGSFDISNSRRSMEALHLDLISSDGQSEYSAEPFDDTVNKNITVTGCTFKNLYSGLGGHYKETKAVTENYEIVNNTFENVQYTAMDIYNVKNAVIKGNKATNTAELIRIFRSDFVMEENSISARVNTEINLYGISVVESTGSLIGNTVDKSNSSGIYIDASTLTKLNNNTVSNSGKHGIGIYNNSTVIMATGNVVTYSKEDGVTISESSADFSWNTIKNSLKYGICADAYNKVSLSYNTIENSTNNAISATGTSSSVSEIDIVSNMITKCSLGIVAQKSNVTDLSGNKISESTSSGIMVVDSSKVLKLDNNTILSPKASGIIIANNTEVDEAKDNTIQLSSATAITITEGSSVDDLEGNDIVNAGKYGIYVSGSIANISSNSIISPKEFGVNASNNSQVEIDDNTIEKAGSYGIFLNGSSGTIVGNTVTGSVSVGIGTNNAKGSQTAPVVISDNKISNSGTMGILVASTSYTNISGNSVSESIGNGIKLDCSDNSTLSGNTVAGSGNQGLVVNGTKNVSITSNTVSDSKYYGILVTSSTGVVATENSAYDNGSKDIGANTSSAGEFKNNYASTSDGVVAYNSPGMNVSSTSVYIGICTISPIANQNYTGNEIKPLVTVKNGETVLRNGIDYRLSYTNNIQPGIAKLTVSGIGAFGGKVELSFTILAGANLTIPEAQTKIEAGAFVNNTVIKNVLIPKTVKEIGDNAFYGCTGLNNVYYTGTEEEWKAITIGKGNELLQAKLVCDYYDKFEDVKINNWYTPYVQRAFKLGIVTGFTDYEFAPSNPLTRAQAITMLYRAAGSPAVELVSPGFTDVPNRPGDWYYRPILWAKSTEIITGYRSGDRAGEFGRLDQITRQAFATIMYRYVEYMGGDVSVTDTESIKAVADWGNVSSFFRTGVTWAYNNGIMGVGTNLNPKGNVSRAEAVTIIMRVIDYLNK